MGIYYKRYSLYFGGLDYVSFKPDNTLPKYNYRGLWGNTAIKENAELETQWQMAGRLVSFYV